MQTADVIVVGAGVIGCSVAHALASEGMRVRVIERDAIGAHASSAAAGMLAPIAEAHAHPALLALGLEALDDFPRRIEALREQSGIDPQLVIRGLVRIRRGGSLPELPARAGDAWKLERWSAAELRSRLPGIAADVEVASYSPREGVVDPIRLTRAYATAAERHGTVFEVGLPVHELLQERGRVIGVRTPQGACLAGHVVWCTGAWGMPHASASSALPIEPVKGQMIALESGALRAGPLIWDDDVYLVPRGDGLVRVGATSERVGFDVTPTARGVSELLQRATRLFPPLAAARFDSTWAGLRPGTPDGLPLVGPIRARPGLSVALGHGRHGILLSALTGAHIARALQDEGAEDARFAPLDPGRFAGVAT